MKPKAMDAKESILANMQVTLLLNKEVSTVKEDLEGVKADVKDLRENASLSAIECEEISKSVRKLGVSLLGGKHSNAYRNRSTRNKVYKDIYRELHRHFDVKSHKAIKRRHLDLAKNKIVEYQLPIVLSEEIHMVNSQIDFSEISQ
ncbi:TPA: ORF6C domain-containing protein [Bacillus cereus]|nr:ORF6C domain-containing protein [Bacillus cereus]